MPGYPHPKGPEFGTLYATPEEALASDEKPVIVIDAEEFREALEDPRVQERLQRVRELAATAPLPMTLEEFMARRQDA